MKSTLLNHWNINTLYLTGLKNGVSSPPPSTILKALGIYVLRAFSLKTVYRASTITTKKEVNYAH